MAGKQVPIVFYPRFTTFIGPGIYYTDPVPCSLFSSVIVSYTQGAYLNGGTVITASFQESNDAVNWTDCAGGPWGPSSIIPGEFQFQAQLTKGWMKFGFILAGNPSGMTGAVRGFFEKREI